MSENNKTYRIRTKIGVNSNSPVADKYLTVNLTDKIDTIEIMSLKIKQENAYKFHSADYGVVVGRAIANGGFGVPNVKVSIFIAATDATDKDPIYHAIYPYTTVTKRNSKKIKYNLLPDVGNDDCYQAVGTFPNKRLVLDDDNYMEIYDTYYKFTTRTNSAGDYMIFGIPTGAQILHFDTDLSDVGILSQKPRDMVYKGYNINQFENANQFKTDTNLANLPQIISQDDSVYVYPFWGDESENIIGITRHDIDINYKFEPTCVFIGSIVSDANSNHISKKCIPSAGMGVMEDLVTGSGTIEMIRKKQDGSIEQFNIQGTQLIDGNGVWCYQIPMNLDYAMTDEYGNLVPSDDPTKGIATRTSVRFRFSMQDFENETANSFRAKVLVPNNPQNSLYKPDYVFGSFTEEESFRDLLWNNVYTVKSFIPRFQKGNGNKNRRFSGIKQCNYHGQSNPIPYNNMRINLSFQFVITCLIVKLIIWAVGVYNAGVTALSNVLGFLLRDSGFLKFTMEALDWMNDPTGGGTSWFERNIIKPVLQFLSLPFRLILSPFATLGNFFNRIAKSLSCTYIDGEMCEQLDGSWYFAPNCGTKKTLLSDPNRFVWRNMMARIEGKKMDEMDFSRASSKNADGMYDNRSIDYTNADSINDEESMVTLKYEGSEEETGKTYAYVISRGINYFLQCIEISLAHEFRVVQFDFYNDWINGMVYVPRWERSLKRKRRFFLFGKSTVEVRACNDNYTKRFFERKNNLTEQCAVSYKAKLSENSIATPVGCKNNKNYKCHKKKGRKQVKIFNDGGVVHQEQTLSGLYAYYFKPCEYITNRNKAKNRKINLFATDIVLLGSLTDCDLNGTPVFTNELLGTTYQLPSPLAHTDSTEEGFEYVGETKKETILTAPGFVGIFDYADSILTPKDDGSITEESGIDWGYTGPGQGTQNKQKTYTPGGHFLGISCVNSESSIKSCVNLKRICEIGVWPSERQEIFNGYDDNNSGTYLDIIPNGLISRDDISGGDFRKLFASLNKNGLRTRVNKSGFTVYDFEYMSPENFGGDLLKYSKANYNDPNPLSDESMNHYLAKNPNDVDEDGVVWGEDHTSPEADELHVKPIRRSLDDADSDYLRFRLGINGRTDGEMRGKFLGSDDYGFYMPVYENSFYFYFGLVPGSTALEEFHKQFFAECKHAISSEDIRLKATISYHKYEIDDAFVDNISVSIFETGVTSVVSDSIKIFSTAVPIKIVVDGDINKSAIITENTDINASYIEYKYSDNPDEYSNMFNLEIGKHVVNITDSEGRTITNLIDVVQQEITLCPKITPVDFTNETYIVNSTARLVNGNILSGSRESLGGWFNFEWGDESQCRDCQGNVVFKYKNISTGNEVCVLDNECTMLFVGNGKIIKVGNWDDDKILSYDEFKNYQRPFIGTIVPSPTYHIYAGEATNYSMYILYKLGNDETLPIMLADGLEIGETDAIDFSIFREIVSSEEDSHITFRNSLIKIWYNNPSDWYNHLYDEIDGAQEITYDQIWYIRKNSFFVFSGSTSQDNEIDEDYVSYRSLYINQFYPSSVGNVQSFVNSVPLSSFVVTGSGIWNMYLTGVSIDDNSGIERPLRTPPIEYNNGIFNFPVFYKPYYYKAVIWEGYSVFDLDSGSPVSYAHVNGNIYNGIVYDSKDENNNLVQVFGPTVLNGIYDISDSVYVITNKLDFDNGSNGRITQISYSDSSISLSNPSNSLLITEGASRQYDGIYSPVEYYIDSNSIGIASAWRVSIGIDLSGTYPTATLNVAGEPGFEFNSLKCLFGKNKPLSVVSNQTEAIETIDVDELSQVGYLVSTIEDVEEGASFNLSIDMSGYGEIQNGAVLLDNLKRDEIAYSQGVTSLGFLSSRNFIRNEISLNYTVSSNKFNFTFSLVSTDDGASIKKIYIENPFADQTFMKIFGNSFLDDVIVVFNDEPNKEYRLIEDFNYNFDYRNEEFVCEVNEESDDFETLVTDDFTNKLLYYYSRGYRNFILKIACGSIGGYGNDNGVFYNNTIDGVSIKYKARIEATIMDE